LLVDIHVLDLRWVDFFLESSLGDSLLVHLLLLLKLLDAHMQIVD
jgi:hypothetical protein